MRTNNISREEHTTKESEFLYIFDRLLDCENESAEEKPNVFICFFFSKGNSQLVLFLKKEENSKKHFRLK
jgi:hypothetical protein